MIKDGRGSWSKGKKSDEVSEKMKGVAQKRWRNKSPQEVQLHITLMIDARTKKKV